MTNKDKIKTIIIKTLIQNGQATRPELIEALGIRPATLFDSINDLKDQGIVIEPERKGKKTGRKASPMRLNGERASFLGIEMQKERAVGVLLDLDGKLLASETMRSAPGKTAADCFAEIDALAQALGAAQPRAWSALAGTGFADLGITDVATGRAIKAVNIPGWENLDLGGYLRKKFGVNATVRPAPSARAHIEQLGSGREGRGLFHMELGSGIGAGFVKNGEVFIGDSHCAMEVGHIVVAPGGALCQCGNRGCLETVAGEDGLRRRVREIAESGAQTSLKSREFSLPFFVECACGGDKAANALALEVCEQVGVALATVVCLLNPGVIVFSGELSGLGDLLVSQVRRTLSLRCFPLALQGLDISVSALGEDATATGTALLSRSSFLLD